jgi:exoribonuclease R
VPHLHLHVTTPAEFAEGLAAIRAELDVPAAFPVAVEAAAETAASRGPSEGAARVDRRDLELVTVDPPGSRDLDQAYGAERRGSGYRVHYAIADVVAFVAAGGTLDGESRARGVTLYCPDGRAPLYPPALGEGAASLLPDVDRPAVLWTLDLDQRGVLGDVGVERAMVCSRRQLDYRSVQATVDDGSAAPALQLLREVGLLREEQERDRGGVSLNLPSQAVEREADGTFALRYDGPLPAEGWNEQISLLTGMAAAKLMLDAGVGLLRTLPPAEPEVFTSLRQSARALGVDWPAERPYPEFVRSLDPHVPAHAALMTQSARVLRGASYAAFDGAPPEQPLHAAIASPYAHVTAPLRRLADRFANEIVLAAQAGERPPAWVLDALPGLPELMDSAHHHERALERAVVDFLEAAVLAPRVGEEFPAMVTGAGRGRATVQLREPAVLASVDDASLAPGTEVRLRLDVADLVARTVTFSLAGA